MLSYNKVRMHANIPLESYQMQVTPISSLHEGKGKKQKSLKIWTILYLISQQKSARKEKSCYTIPALCEKIDKLLIALVVVFVI